MSISWPVSLPQYVEKDQYTESPPDARIRTQMDMGPPKVRRRFSAQVRPFQVVLTLDKEQLDTFDEFWRIGTAGGSLAFEFPNPRGEGMITVRFGEDAPEYGQFRGDRCSVTVQLEELP